MEWKFIYSLPEIVLLIGVVHLLILHFLKFDNAKSYVSSTRFWLILSVFLSIIFYNKCTFSNLFNFNAYTLLCILLICIFLYAVFFLSGFWFSSQKRTGCRFYATILWITIIMMLLLGTTNLFILLCGFITLLICNNLLLKTNGVTFKNHKFVYYLHFFDFFMVVCMVSSIGYIYLMNKGNMDYISVKNLFSLHQNNFLIYLSGVGIIIPFLYLLGISPFHIIHEEKIGYEILPVSHYFVLVEPFFIWCLFFKINQIIYPCFANALSPAYQIFAILSVIMGAIGSNARINLYRIFSFGLLFNNGVVLLLISFGNETSIFSAFIYLLFSSFAFNGLYTIFYNLKSHGEYLATLSFLAGLAKTRSYTTNALTICLFSLIGLPPLIGFLSSWVLWQGILSHENYIALCFVFVFLLVLAKAYLEIIKTVYFDKKIKIFDSENKFIVLYTSFNIILLLALVFNPYHFIEHLKDMFYVLFL